MSAIITPGRTTARLQIVEDHVRFECAHELEPLVGTFGSDPVWNHVGQDLLRGHDAIREFYGGLFRGFPNFWLDIRQRHVADDAIVLEGLFGGTHTSEWMGIPASGKEVSMPFCAIFLFTEDDRLKSETVYYDRLALMTQLGAINLPG